MKQNIKGYSLKELEEVAKDLGIESYRAPQIFQWLWQRNTRDFSEMTSLSKDLRKILNGKFEIINLVIEQILKAKDGTEKFLFKLEDEQYIESVYIPEGKRKTICVSTQVGCPLSCKFCATALLGFERNLRAYEIVEQIQLIQEEISKRITNIVFMGMGEPLLNIEEVIKAIEIISSPIGLGISQKHTTISTVGLIEGIRYLLKSPLKIKLAISLNFPDEELRKETTPVAKNNPLKEVLKLAKAYSIKKQMVTFEYVMIDGLNDKIDDAKKLVKLLRGIPAKINLIPYNPYPSLPYKRPTDKKIKEFYEYLLNFQFTITLRKSRGQEILAGCGQLAGGYLDRQNKFRYN